jgi:Na+-transporting methylmalonyl-CoA/oxaloacetate decarboxylase gamma subunit
MGLFGGEMVQNANLVVEGVVIVMGFLITHILVHFHKTIGNHGRCRNSFRLTT